jgi:hypothetical protein
VLCFPAETNPGADKKADCGQPAAEQGYQTGNELPANSHFPRLYMGPTAGQKGKKG